MFQSLNDLFSLVPPGMFKDHGQPGFGLNGVNDRSHAIGPIIGKESSRATSHA